MNQTTALDVLVQDKILRELRDIQKQLNMSMIYISHDIATVAEMSHRIGVMYAGKIVELADSEELLHNPRHPYTRALISAVPVLDAAGRGEPFEIKGGVSKPVDPPPRCRFYDRCPMAAEICRTNDHPPLEKKARGHYVACYKV